MTRQPDLDSFCMLEPSSGKGLDAASRVERLTGTLSMNFLESDLEAEVPRRVTSYHLATTNRAAMRDRLSKISQFQQQDTCASSR